MNISQWWQKYFFFWFLVIHLLNSLYLLILILFIMKFFNACYSLTQFFPIFWCLLPYYGSGVGVYAWSYTSGGCLSFILQDSLGLTIFYTIYASLLITIIVVTTIWTFLFTHVFLKKSVLLRQGEVHGSSKDDHVYKQKIRNLIGIFGVLLMVNLCSWFSHVFPPVFYSLMGDSISRVPVEIESTLFIFSLSNTVANPILQMYFRQEIRETMKRMLVVCRSFLSGVQRKFSTHERGLNEQESK